MKKLLSILTTVAVICCLLGVSAAADASAKVYVTVANGGLELANSEVTVTDIDGDGALTINDALYAAHECSRVRCACLSPLPRRPQPEGKT